MEYEVLWGDGPLGLTLRPDLGEDMPPVVGRITRLDSAAALAKVAVGDMLVSINGIDTARQGYDHVVDLLQKIQRPATLRFRVPRPVSGANSSVLGVPRVPSMARERSSRHRDTRGSTASTSSVSSSSSVGAPPMVPRKNEQYTVVWTEGPLGMILRPDDDDVHVPCIRKITGKGAGTGMERAAVGDVLVAVNGQETKSLGFRSTISLLKTIRKPAVLKFKRMHRRVSRRRSSREDDATNGGHPTSHSISGGMPPPMPSGGSVSVPKEYGAYDIVWREGDLGLKLKPGDRDVPVLSKLTGKGTASGLQNANVGDELVSVNGVLVDGQAYHDTLRMLKHSVKPAVLRFRSGYRRASGMSITSISSTRSAPSTTSEHVRARSGHVPIYDTGRVQPPPSSSLQRSTSSKMSRSPSGERRKKKRIPLDLAKELVAASQGVELESAMFAGLPILSIHEGTNEAHLLRVEAKMCITAKKDQTRNGLTPKEALLRAEEEARVLQEALERVKNQAKAYETALEHQKKEQLLKTATQNKSGDVVKKHNILLDELAGAIAGLKRDSYSEVDVVPMQLGNEEEMQGLMDDLQSVMNIPVVVPSTKFCAECGATEKESKLDLDDDGNYYCTDCWDNFLSTPGADTVEAPVPEVVPASPPAAPVVVPVIAEKKPEPTYSPPQPSLTKSESATSSLSRLSSVEREQEEKNARVEAEKKLMELKELKRTGSTRSLERQSSSMNAADRTRRERRGLEELAQALLEEEERARAEGNLALAKKLNAQRVRTMAEAQAEQQQQQQKRNGLGHFSSMRDVLETSEPEFARFYKNGSKNGSSGMSSSYDGPSSAIAEAAANDDVPPPVSLKRSVTLDSPYAASSKPLEVMATTTAVAAAASEPAVVANDYDDVDEDEEAEDQVDLSDGDNDVLREVEEKNFALAKQLGEAHNVIQRARQSIMLSGDETAEEMSLEMGLTEDQISLFKKLTSQADERMSTVDRLHPDEDDSDSDDSDSDRSEKSGGGDDDDEEDEGVWI